MPDPPVFEFPEQWQVERKRTLGESATIQTIASVGETLEISIGVVKEATRPV